MNGKGLAEGIALGTGIARTINDSISDRDRLKQQKEQFALQQQLEQTLQQRQFANQMALQNAGFSESAARQAAEIQSRKELQAAGLEGQKDLQATNLAGLADREDIRSRNQLARDKELQDAIANRQFKLQRDAADYSSEKQSHSLQNQFDAYHATKQQYAQELKAATATGDPEAIAAAQDKLQSWTQAGASLFAQAQKDAALNYTIDPTDGKMKVTGKVSSPEELQRIQSLLVKPDSESPEGLLDAAIAEKKKSISQMQVANPLNQASWYTWFNNQNPSDRARLESELQANLASRAALQPGQTDQGEDPTATLVPAPAAPAPGTPTTFNQYQEGQQALNPKTGQKMIFRNGAWSAFQ